jgi:hypothetical protein
MGWLTSCDDEALAGGANLAVLGGELVQFGRVTPLGAGSFRLSRLLRGRGGTEWARGYHSNGEVFCLIQTASLQPVAMPSWSVGAFVTATGAGGASASIAFGAEALRPPSPVNLSAELQSGGDLRLSWTRRSRQGFAWIDGVDAPLGEAREQYRVTITSGTDSVELSANEPSLLVPAAILSTLGTGSATIEVWQIGDFAASRPAQLNISFS